MSSTHWNPQDAHDRRVFAGLLAPLAYAARCHDFDAPRNEAERRDLQMRLTTWMQPFLDVPHEILQAAFARVLTRGVGWMPRADEVKAVCCDLVDERRAVAAKEAARIRSSCEVCYGAAWITVLVNGAEQARRCDCWTAAIQLVTDAGQAIRRPALPAYEPEAT